MKTLVIYFVSLVIAFQVNGQDIRKEMKEICKNVNETEIEESLNRLADLDTFSLNKEVILSIPYSYLKYYLESSERLTIVTGSDELENKRIIEGKIKTIENSLDAIKENTTAFEELPKGGLFSGLFKRNSKRKVSKRCPCIDRKGDRFTELFEQYNDTLQKRRQQLNELLAPKPDVEVSNTTIEIENDSIMDIFSQYEDELRDRDETVERFKVMMGKELEELAQERTAEIMEISGEEEAQDSVSLEVTVHDVDSIEFETYLISESVETLAQEDTSEYETVSEEEVPGEVEPSFESIQADTESNLDSVEVSINEDIAELEEIVSEDYTSDTIMVLSTETASDIQVISTDEEVSESEPEPEPEDVVLEEVISDITDTMTILVSETTSDTQVIPDEEEDFLSENVVILSGSVMVEDITSNTTAIASEYTTDLKTEETPKSTEVVNQKDTLSEMLLSQEHGVAEYCNTKVNSIVESSTFEILKKWLKVVELMEVDTLEISVIVVGEADDTWRNKGVKHTFIEVEDCRGIGKEIGLKDGDKISNETIALLRMLSAEMYVRKGIESTLSKNGGKRPYVKVRSTKVSHRDWMNDDGKQSGPKYRKKLVILKCHTCE